MKYEFAMFCFCPVSNILNKMSMEPKPRGQKEDCLLIFSLEFEAFTKPLSFTVKSKNCLQKHFKIQLIFGNLSLNPHSWTPINLNAI
jgi:hypothetical protein